MTSFFDHFRSNGRYRFRRGRSLDPNEGVHPELTEDGIEVGSGVPSTIDELMAMQRHEDSNPNDHPKKPEKGKAMSEKLQKVLSLIQELDTSAEEDRDLALHLLRHLEIFHDRVVADLQKDQTADHTQLTAWAVDADRLMHCRIILETIEFAD